MGRREQTLRKGVVPGGAFGVTLPYGAPTTSMGDLQDPKMEVR